ncbi:MAG: hypothetical protein MUD14_20080 [Hydrococcus sp. Prado102]|jgi:hypothetical protein|nr:hypothetical protein [Hydrococcus sp. Prado102]
MPIKIGALLIAIGWVSFLGACSQIEEKNTSKGEFQPIDQFLEANSEKQTTDDQEVFLLEQQTPEGELVESNSTDISGLDEVPEESLQKNR